MISSTTNKQPMLVDQPLHTFVKLGPATALSDPNNLNSIIGGGCSALVDCYSSNGAVVDSLSVVANEASTTAARVVFFISSSPTPIGITVVNTAAVASVVIASSTVGERTNVALPPIAVPVMHNGGMTTLTEFTKKNTGLYVPAGNVLYAGLSEVIVSPSPTTVVNVYAQGGLF